MIYDKINKYKLNKQPKNGKIDQHTNTYKTKILICTNIFLVQITIAVIKDPIRAFKTPRKMTYSENVFA